jgi:hypothetical protein
MKTLHKILWIFLLTSLFLVGCEKDFDSINKNPNLPEKAATPYLLTYAERAYAYTVYDVWFSGRMGTLACQHWGQRNYTSEDRYLFRSSVTNTYFRNLYFYMMNLQEIIRLNTVAATKSEMAIYGDNNAQIATAMILKAWAFQLITDSWGDVPYSEALDPVNKPTPKYDAQKDIYAGLIEDLKSAVSLIGSTTSCWTSGDVIYDGDMVKWKKFANSIRLRLALRMSNVDAAKSSTEAAAAIAAGVFTSNDDNAIFVFLKDGAPNAAPIYTGYITEARNDFSPTKQFVNLMKGLNDPDIRAGGFTNPFNRIVDPRLAIYRGDAMDATTIGIPYGAPDVIMKSFVSSNSNVINYYIKDKLAKIIQPNFGSTLLDYPTVCFMLSEINSWNRTWFENGITASCKQWGVVVDSTTKYVDKIMAKFDATTTDEQKKEMVITQKYIHLFTQSHEAWSEYRRTGFPKSIVKPGEVTLVNGTVITKFTPGSSSGVDIVARFKYPNSEFTLNKTSVDAAISKMALGGDDLKTKVWWAGGGVQ